MINKLLKFLLIITAIIGWIFFILTVFISVRWHQFVLRNENAKEILAKIILRVIFFD